MNASIIATNKETNAWRIVTDTTDDVFLAPCSSPLDVHGCPMGARWECSYTHFMHYRETVFNWLQ